MRCKWVFFNFGLIDKYDEGWGHQLQSLVIFVPKKKKSIENNCDVYNQT